MFRGKLPFVSYICVYYQKKACIFINDMPDMMESMCQLFADVAKLFRNVDIRDESNIKKLQDHLDKLTEWSKKWQLPFDVKNI